MAEQIYLAIDLGASGGRVVAGALDGDRLRLDDVHRFENGAVPVADSLYWDVLRLWEDVRSGLRLAASKYGNGIRACGVDTWGVDYALLGRGDTILGNPHSYRDPRVEGMMARAIEKVGRDTIFAQTGLQFMPINTLYQLMAMSVGRSPVLEAAESFLMIPDLFHWLLSGTKTNEATNSSTTQCFDPRKHDWARPLLEQLDVPTRIFGPIVEPGTNLGRLRATVAADTGLANVDVILPGTHDTASAVLAVPAQVTANASRPDWCYISCGTWSLMGVETREPVINDACLRWNFTNEGGVAGTNRLLKNITGLWLVQECRRVWAQQGRKYEWDELTAAAQRAPSLAALVDPDDALFQAPGDMPEAIRQFCRRTGQPPPEEPGAVIRTAIESIALKQRYVLGALEDLTGGRIERVHMVGGGVRNRQLCQATADACGRPVIAGPVEATALGNVLMQAIATGALGSIADARELIRRSQAVESYEPRDTARWDTTYEKFRSVCGL